MKLRVSRSKDTIRLEFGGAEAKAFLEELLDVPGGTKLPWIRQTAERLERLIGLCETPTSAYEPENRRSRR